MAIKTTGQRYFRSANNQVQLSNTGEASFHIKARFEPDGNPAQSTRTILFGGDGGTYFHISYGGPGTAAGTLKTRFFIQSASASTYRDIDTAVGAVYSFGIVYSQTTGHRCFVNGQRYSLPTLAGAMPAFSIGFGTGLWTGNPLGSIFSVQDLAMWEGYALTDQQFADLRDDVIDPGDITGGTWRGWYTLAGTPGATVTLGDAGLANQITGQVGGDFDLTVAGGTGAAVYVAPLAWEATSEPEEIHVGTSGRTLFVYMKSIATGIETLTKACNIPPTLKLNGSPIGAAVPTCINTKQRYAAFNFPAGFRAVAGDTVTISAPANWLDTVAGASDAMADFAVINNTGKSCFRGDDYEKTLQLGINTEYGPTEFGSLGQYMKNISKRLGTFRFVDQYGANDRPTRMAPPATSCTSPLYTRDGDNGIDATGYVGPTGLYAVGWDDTRPSVPLNVRIYARDTATTLVTPRPEYDNPGAIDGGGVRRGVVKVYEVARKPGSTKYSINIGAIFENAEGRLDFDNLIINHEHDFTPGTPTVLDNSDPYALSQTFIDAFKGAKSIRCWTSQIGGVTSPTLEREHTRPLEDFTWSFGKNRFTWRVEWIQASPLILEDTPYYYLPQFGEKYTATLSVACSSAAPYATDTFTIIKDAGPGNDIIIGSRLFLGDEICRVTDVLPSNQYAVIRGIENTTPTAHSAGTIDVGYRSPMINPGGSPNTNFWSSGHFLKLTSNAPHKLLTGWVLGMSKPTPMIPFADGEEVELSDWWGAMVVTGPDTVVLRTGPMNAASLPGSTLVAPITLDPAVYYSSILIPSNPILPFAMMSKAANQMDVPNCFFCLPNTGTDDFFYWIAEQIRDNLEPGRKAYIEIGNEQWNGGYSEQFSFHFTSATSLWPGETLWACYVERYKRAREIFEEVWGPERSADLRFFINQQTVFVRQEVLNYAAAQDPPIKIDAVGTAPYHDAGGNYMSAETVAAWATLEPDEIIDLWIHNLWHPVGNYGPKYAAQKWLEHMATYTAATGFPLELITYEGGFNNFLTSSIANYKEKEHDIWYHPNMYICIQDMIANLQEGGYTIFNWFGSFGAWFAARNWWQLYQYHYHEAGRGDGSDGKANNLLCLARPGQVNTKLPTTNQDYENVCVVAGAWLAWNAEEEPEEPPPPPDTTIVVDTCTDTAGTAATAHTPEDGGAITVVSGTSAVVTAAGRFRQGATSASSVIHYYAANPATADYSVAADVIQLTVTVSAIAGVFGRYSAGADNGYYLRYSHASLAIQLYRRLAGTSVLLASYAYTATLNTPFRLLLQMSGSTIIGKLNGATVISYTDGTPITAAGHPGFALAGSTTPGDSVGLQLDNINADDAGEVVSPATSFGAGILVGV